MKNIAKVIALIISIILAILGIMFVFDLVGGPESKDIAIKVLEVGGILLLLSIIVMFISKPDNK
jgi:RsiW-degrading membrane proteinase PrsW (M82 family)